MNIFVLDEDPVLAAKYHCDKHIVKMAVETNQMLATAYHFLSKDKSWKGFPSDNIYKITHINHPCSIWVRESEENYTWTILLGLAIGDEHYKRYGKRTKSYEVTKWFFDNIVNVEFKKKTLTKFMECMDDVYKRDNPILSYRNLYMTGKRDICKWKKDKPVWFS
jgi:hypothetical protein